MISIRRTPCAVVMLIGIRMAGVVVPSRTSRRKTTHFHSRLGPGPCKQGDESCRNAIPLLNSRTREVGQADQKGVTQVPFFRGSLLGKQTSRRRGLATESDTPFSEQVHLR